MLFEAEYIRQCENANAMPVPAIINTFKNQLDQFRAAAESKDYESDEEADVRLILQGNSLELFNNRLNDDDIINLCNSIESSTALGQVVEMDLRNNNIGDRGVEAIVRLLELHRCRLERLNLESNCVTFQGTKLIAKVLSGTIEEPLTTGLTQLSLNGNPIGNEGGMELAKMLKTNCCLKSLDVGNSDQEAESMIAFSTVLCHNTTITSFNIDNPRIVSKDEETTAHYAELIKANSTLKSLSLAKHQIRDDGVKLLVDALVRNHSLVSLNLRCNQIGVGGARAIALLLINSGTLTSLNLHANRITRGGAQAIGEALAFNDCLEHLNIANNTIDDVGLVSIAEGLSQNKHLKTCRVWGNGFGELSSHMFLDVVRSPVANRLQLDIRPYVAEYDRSKHIVQIAKA